MDKKLEKIYWRRVSGDKDLLDFLATAEEKRDLATRAAILEGLSVGKGHRPLSRELSVSLQTINSVKKAIDKGVYRSYSERGKTERKKKIYSPTRAPKKKRPEGRAVRTKYGIIYTQF